MIRSKKIHTNPELEDYQEIYFRLTDNTIDMDYLRRSDVYVLLNSAKQICGGFVLNSKLPFRYFEALSPDRVTKVLSSTELSLDNCVELGCVFLYPQLRKGWFYPASWWIIVAHTMLSGKKYILAGTHVKKHMKFQTCFLPHILFSDTLYIHTCDRVLPYWLFYNTRWRFFSASIKSSFAYLVKGKAHLKTLFNRP